MQIRSPGYLASLSSCAFFLKKVMPGVSRISVIKLQRIPAGASLPRARLGMVSSIRATSFFLKAGWQRRGGHCPVSPPGVEPCLRVRSSCRLSWGPETRGRRRAWSLQPVPHLPQHGRPESPPGQAADTTHEQVRVPGGGQPGATWPPRPQPRGGRCFPWCRAQVPFVASPCGTPSASRAGHFFRICPCLFLVPGFY